jgi:hypothetical protein
MGLSVEDEVRCPKSGYSIDMRVHDSALEIGGERAVEFDGPSHFLATGAPTGATLLKRRLLVLLGHALVSVPCWEWGECKGACSNVGLAFARHVLMVPLRHELSLLYYVSRLRLQLQLAPQVLLPLACPCRGTSFAGRGAGHGQTEEEEKVKE